MPMPRSALFQHQPFDGADHGHRFRHGRMLGTPNAKMKEQLAKGGPKLFTPWMALQDQELAQED